MSEQVENKTGTTQRIILFVCFGNVHRSVLAEELSNAVLKQNGLDANYVAVSRGIQGYLDFEKPKHQNLMEYDIEWKLTQVALTELGVDVRLFLNKISTPIDAEIVGKSFVIVAMDQKVYNILNEHFPENVSKFKFFKEWMNTLEVDDLVGCDEKDKYLAVNKSIVQGIQNNLIDRLGGLF